MSSAYPHLTELSMLVRDLDRAMDDVHKVETKIRALGQEEARREVEHFLPKAMSSAGFDLSYCVADVLITLQRARSAADIVRDVTDAVIADVEQARHERRHARH